MYKIISIKTQDISSFTPEQIKQIKKMMQEEQSGNFSSVFSGNINGTTYKIMNNGTIPQAELTLPPGKVFRTEQRIFQSKEAGIQQDTQVGGILKGVKRMFLGENFFIPTFINQANKPQKLTLRAPYAGQIIPIDLSKCGGKIFCQRGAFIAGEKDLDIKFHFSGLKSGLLGGEGFYQQELSGNGLVLLHGAGTITQKNLSAGEVLDVDKGSLLAWEPSVSYSAGLGVGGIKNAIIGGEEFFKIKLTGPGKVYLHSVPFNPAVDQNRPQKSNSGFKIGFGGSGFNIGF